MGLWNQSCDNCAENFFRLQKLQKKKFALTEIIHLKNYNMDQKRYKMILFNRAVALFAWAIFWSIGMKNAIAEFLIDEISCLNSDRRTSTRKRRNIFALKAFCYWIFLMQYREGMGNVCRTLLTWFNQYSTDNIEK